MIPFEWLEEAAERITPHIRITPLTYDPNNDLYLKWENHQVTGSFKVRGAVNKVLSLQKWEQEKGLVAASAGNHGQGVALAGSLVNAPVTIFASDKAVETKIEAMRSLGAEVQLVEGGYGEAEKAGLEYAAEMNGTWVSPYNDVQVIAGQGTLALETSLQLPALEKACWITPVGGGGLASGLGSCLKGQITRAARKDRLVGVQSQASPFAYHVFNYGSQDSAKELPSLADGLAGPIEANSVTLPLIRHYLDAVILVSEGEIADAIAYAWERYKEVLEGSAAAALAAALTRAVPDRPAVIVLTGGNIQPELHQEIVRGERGLHT